MNKRIVVFSILIIAGILLAACSPALTEGVLVSNPSAGQRPVSFSLQATQVPPVVSTIVVNPAPAPGGGAALPSNGLMILVYVLVAAIVVIALVAMLRKSS